VRVRISAQLADVATGAHRWAERYDREIENVFAVQDEMARTIATILAAHVNKAEIERTLHKPPAAWQAYDYYLRALDAYLAFWPSYKEAELHEVRRLLEQSIAIDPNYARAWARLGGTYLSAWINPYDGDHLNPAALDRAHELARKAVQLDPNLPEAQAIFAHVLSRRGEHDASIAAIERAMALNPNFMDWRFAEVLVLAGEPVRAIAALERHMRLDPFYSPLAPGWLGLAHCMLKQHSRALAPSRECAAQAPNTRLGHLCLAAAYAQLGKANEARAEAAEVLRIDPNWTISKGALLLPFKRSEDAEHFFDSLRKAGLPD
jgi:adenylate cyclase